MGTFFWWFGAITFWVYVVAFFLCIAAFIYLKVSTWLYWKKLTRNSIKPKAIVTK